MSYTDVFGADTVPTSQVAAGYFAGTPVLALMCVGYVGLILFNMRSLP